MAILNPDIDTIQRLRQKPTEGELHLLRFLNENLDDSFEVFFQPYLNGDMPDIIIMREGSGVYIIEVKDYNLNIYSRGPSNWYVETGGIKKQEIPSPIKQVLKYKENLYNLHIEGLLEKKIKDFKYLSIVTCALYFHKETTENIKSFVEQKSTEKDHEKYLKFISYMDFFGFDQLKQDIFKKMLSARRMDKKSYLFNDQLYNSFKRYLNPPTHVTEQGIEIQYNSEQSIILGLDPSLPVKIKGVAGCGKTMVLSKRAVMAHKRHNDNVLILTFNISLKNFIHDKISQIRENYSWSAFHINHYHGFFKSQVINLELTISGIGSWSDKSFFEPVKDKIKKYRTIIIDEIQDFEKEWILILRNYFLAENGEILFFGDEKQNIYSRLMEEGKPYTGVKGAWRKMSFSYRMANNIARISTLFQKHFFVGKYELDEIILKQSQIDIFEEIDKPVLKYFNISGNKEPVKAIVKAYKIFAEEKSIHNNDIVILCSKVRYLREVDFEVRLKNIKTNVMFESVELLKELCLSQNLEYQEFLEIESRRGQINDKEKYAKYWKIIEDVDDIRRNKKLHYYPNPGTLKLSTTHSFKGWESHTLILIIDEEEDENNAFTNHELIYTSLTRCRVNLIVINFGNIQYDQFFTKAEVKQFFEATN
jgi:hypothetical protein